MARMMREGRAMILAAMLMATGGAASAAALTPQEKANKELVLGFYAALDRADAAGTSKQDVRGIAERYLSPEYVQHSEMGGHGEGNARDGFVSMMENSPPRPATPPALLPKRVAVMADGDRVILVTSREVPDPAHGATRPAFIFNMFRVANGKLVEHWDALPASLTGAPPPPPAAGRN